MKIAILDAVNQRELYLQCLQNQYRIIKKYFNKV